MTVEFKSEIVDEWFQGGKSIGPGWESIAKMGPPKWSTGGPIPWGHDFSAPVPDSLCGNCRRDRHEYPLTENVAQMWQSVTFNEDYDPDTDVSRIVCPGSDVCGPVAAPKSPSNYGWSTNSSMEFINKVLAWPEPYLPSVKWEMNIGSTWNIDAVQELKDQWTYKAGHTVDYMAFDGTSQLFTLSEDEKIPEAFAPIPQAALEAAPKAIEMAHKVPEPPGFDFSGWNGKPALYTYMKRKKK